MKTTEQKNRMIAEFMGLEPLSSDPKNFFFYRPLNNYIYIKSMQYNSSWDWLIPVIGEVKYSAGGSDEITDVLDRIDSGLLGRNIEYTFNYVVEFIEWYNNQK